MLEKKASMEVGGICGQEEADHGLIEMRRLPKVYACVRDNEVKSIYEPQWKLVMWSLVQAQQQRLQLLSAEMVRRQTVALGCRCIY